MTRKIKLIIRHNGLFHARVKTSDNKAYRVFFTSIAQLINFELTHGLIIRYERI